MPGELVLHADDLRGAGEAGDRAGDEGHRNCRRLTGTPENSAVSGACPDDVICSPSGVRDITTRRLPSSRSATMSPSVDPAAGEQDGQVVAGAEPVGVGEAGLGVAPGPVEQPLHEEQRDRVEQQRGDDLVDAGAPLEPGRHGGPGEPADGTGDEADREGHRPGSPVNVVPTQVTPTAPARNWPSAPMLQ